MGYKFKDTKIGSINCPRLTVIMPVYNGEKYLYESINSVLCQTFEDFELIILNDGSNDGSCEIIQNYLGSDKRIKYLFSHKNQGLVHQLNRGLENATGEYIARMDADDISKPNRFQRQISFMEENPQIGVCGTWMQTFGGIKKKNFKSPLHHASIFSGMLFGTKIWHATVFIRREMIVKLNQFYNPDFIHAEDYEYWARLGLLGVKFANVGEVLYKYRLHSGQVTKTYDKVARKNLARVSSILMRKLGVQLSLQDLEVVEGIAYKLATDLEFFEKVYLLFVKISETNKKNKMLPEAALDQALSDEWFDFCYACSRHGLDTWKIFKKLDNFRRNPLAFHQKISLLLKCILRINNVDDLSARLDILRNFKM